MLKNKNYFWILALALGFFTCMLIFAFSAGQQAEAISDNVLRFHIVANSDSEQDQKLKMKVRDGIAKLTDTLFEMAADKEQAVQIALQNTETIRKAAQDILRENGSFQTVQVEIKNLYFPTKSYENIAFPAGNYDAIHITLGEGKGENFWCVMFPALCVSTVSQDNTELLSGVLDKEEIELVTHPYEVKFKAAEWLGKLKHLFSKKNP